MSLKKLMNLIRTMSVILKFLELKPGKNSVDWLFLLQVIWFLLMITTLILSLIKHM